MSNKTPFFAPQLFIKSGAKNVNFYINGLGATELRRFSNVDGTIHVSELSISGALFHLHEEKIEAGEFEPIKNKGVTCLIGLFVDDVDKVVNKAIDVGATLVKAPQSYDYGYRQAEIEDPFGHIWLIEQKI